MHSGQLKISTDFSPSYCKSVSEFVFNFTTLVCENVEETICCPPLQPDFSRRKKTNEFSSTDFKFLVKETRINILSAFEMMKLCRN